MVCWYFFNLNETAATGTYTRAYTLSLHDALPISSLAGQVMIKSKIEMTNTIIPINLTSGIYIVNVISEGDSVFSDKIIVG